MTLSTLYKKYPANFKTSGDKWGKYLWFYPSDISELTDALKAGFIVQYDTEDGFCGYYDAISQKVISFGITITFKYFCRGLYTVKSDCKEIADYLSKLTKDGYLRRKDLASAIEYVDALWNTEIDD